MSRYERYAALLRGINVGTAKRVAMSELRGIVEALDFSEVRTLLNSGNVVFSGGRQRCDAVAEAIEEALTDRVGVRARVIVLTSATFNAVVEQNPLTTVATDPSRHLVAFLRDPGGGRGALKELTRRSWAPEALAVGAQAAYLWCPAGVLKSPLASSLGKALGDDVTTRNWATVAKVRDALR